MSEQPEERRTRISSAIEAIRSESQPAADHDSVLQDATDPEHVIAAAFRDAEATVRALQQKQRERAARRQQLLGEPGNGRGLDRLSALRDWDVEAAELGRQLEAATATCLSLGDAVHPMKLRGIGREQDRLRAEARVLEAKQAAEVRRATELQAEVDVMASRLRDPSYRDQVFKLHREADRLDVSERRRMRVHLAAADPLHGPRLVKPSAWHAFVSEAQARGLTGSIEVQINELNGTVKAL